MRRVVGLTVLSFIAAVIIAFAMWYRPTEKVYVEKVIKVPTQVVEEYEVEVPVPVEKDTVVEETETVSDIVE